MTMTYKELAPLVVQQWATIKNIKDMAEVGDEKAREIFRAIKKEIIAENKLVLARKVPMDRVLKKLEINKDKVLKYSKEGK